MSLVLGNQLLSYRRIIEIEHLIVHITVCNKSALCMRCVGRCSPVAPVGPIVRGSARLPLGEDRTSLSCRRHFRLYPKPTRSDYARGGYDPMIRHASNQTVATTAPKPKPVSPLQERRGECPLWVTSGSDVYDSTTSGLPLEADIRFRLPIRSMSLCYSVFTDRRSFLVIADCANLISDLGVEGSLLQRLV
jgi:hypothetical protein